MTRNTYGRGTRFLHWLTGAMLLAMVVMGLSMAGMEEAPLRTTLLNIHVQMGMGLGVLIVLRVVWRFVDPWPPPPAGIEGARATAFKWNHIVLYVVMVLLIASGIGMVLGTGVEMPATLQPADIVASPPRTAHQILGWVFNLMVAMHVVGLAHFQMHGGESIGRMLGRPRR